MLALIQKNVRIHRSVLIGQAVVTGLAFAVLLVPVLFGNHRWPSLAPMPSPVPVGETLKANFVVAAWFSLFASCIVGLSFGAGAVATERQTRWADFEHLLPVPQWTRVWAKLLTAAGLTLLVFLLHAGPCVVAYRFAMQGLDTQLTGMRVTDVRAIDSWHVDALRQWGLALLTLFCGSTGGFGVSWLASVLLRNTALAAACGIGLTLSLTLLLLVVPQLGEMNDILTPLLPRYDVVMLTLGVLGTATGTAIALSRRGA